MTDVAMVGFLRRAGNNDDCATPISLPYGPIDGIKGVFCLPAVFHRLLGALEDLLCARSLLYCPILSLASRLRLMVSPADDVPLKELHIFL